MEPAPYWDYCTAGGTVSGAGSGDTAAAVAPGGGTGAPDAMPGYIPFGGTPGLSGVPEPRKKG